MSKGMILSPKEEIIMSRVWLSEKPLRVKEIIESLPDPKPHFNTISTFVRGLNKKGWLTHLRDGNTHLYAPAISLDEYRRATLQRVSSLLFADDYDQMIHFLQNESFD